MSKKVKIEPKEELNIEELKKLSTKEIALKGNIDSVILVLAECDIKKYLKYRIMLITDESELRELKEMYQYTEWFNEVINSIKVDRQHKKII